MIGGLMTSNNIEDLNLNEITKLFASRLDRYNPITEETFAEVIHSKATLDYLFAVNLNASKFIPSLKIIKKEGVSNNNILWSPVNFLTDSFRDNGTSIDNIVNELFSEKYQGEQKTLRLLIAYSLFIQSCYAWEILGQSNAERNRAIKSGCLFDETQGFEWLYIFHLVRMAELKKKHIEPRHIRENVINYFDIDNSTHSNEIFETIKTMRNNLSVFTEFIFEQAIESNEFKEIMRYFYQYIFNDSSDVNEDLLENRMFTDLYDLID